MKFVVDVRLSHNVCLGVLTCTIIIVHARGHRPVSAFSAAALSIVFALCQHKWFSFNKIATLQNILRFYRIFYCSCFQ